MNADLLKFCFNEDHHYYYTEKIERGENLLFFNEYKLRNDERFKKYMENGYDCIKLFRNEYYAATLEHIKNIIEKQTDRQKDYLEEDKSVIKVCKLFEKYVKV